MSNEQEQSRLDDIANRSRYGEGLSGTSVAYAFKVFKRFLERGPILELGPAEGIMTDKLATLGFPLTVVEGGRAFCDAIAERHPNVKVVHSLFEDYRSDQKYQTIILGHVLEHVCDPVAILQLVGNWLRPGGKVLASVPNSRSIHRQAAVIMGLLPHEEELNQLDMWHGHRRVYSPESFRRDFIEAGLRIEVFGGYWLKPMSNAQLETSFTPEMVEAFMQMGERYPDVAAEIYVVAGRL